MDAAFQHCADEIRARDKDRFIATLFAPAAARPGLFALYAYHLELSRTAYVAREPLAGEIRLQWWRDVLNSGAAGESAGHPVAAALLATIERSRLPVAPLVAMSEAHIFDLYSDLMPTFGDLEGYAGETRGALIQLAAIVLAGGEDPGSATAAGHAGVAQTLSALVEALPANSGRGQTFLPRDLLARHGVPAAPAGVVDPDNSAAVSGMLKEIADHHGHHLTRMEQLLPSVLPAARAAFLPLAPSARVLRRAPAAARRRDWREISPPAWLRQLDIWRGARRLRRLPAPRRQGPDLPPADEPSAS